MRSPASFIEASVATTPQGFFMLGSARTPA
jgi:hypothetical protein